MSHLSKILSAIIVVGVGCAVFLFKVDSSEIFSAGPEIELKKAFEKENVVPFLVLGSGPASLAAALYGARTKIRTVVLRGNTPGGALTGTSYIENWPGIRKIRGAEVVKDFEDQAAYFGAVMISDVATSVDFTQWPYVVNTEEGKTFYALSVCIGTGATPRVLGVPGEHEYWGKGVTTCAICDAPYHKGDDVVVVGGGDSAMEEALELSPYAQKVYVLSRTEALRASPSMLEKIEECSNVEIVFNKSVTKINGDGEHITSIEVKDNKTKKEEEWDTIRGVFLGIGHLPNSTLFKDQLKLDKNGFIKVKGRTQHTSLPGVVTAGEVCDHRYRQAGVAAGDGIKAGLDAMWWLMDIGYNPRMAEKLEPYMFDEKLEKRISIDQLNSLEEFETFMSDADEELIILDFYTPFCPSCMHMMPALEWVGSKLAGKVKFVKVDASIAFDVVKHFQAPQVPYFVVLKDGKQVGNQSEALSRTELYEFVKRFL